MGKQEQAVEIDQTTKEGVSKDTPGLEERFASNMDMDDGEGSPVVGIKVVLRVPKMVLDRPASEKVDRCSERLEREIRQVWG